MRCRDVDGAAGTQQPGRFGDESVGIRDVLEHLDRADDVEPAGRKIELLGQTEPRVEPLRTHRVDDGGRDFGADCLPAFGAGRA